MWFSDKFFYEYPPVYKKGDVRFSSISAQYDTQTAEIERDNREDRGEDLGEPIDLTNVVPAEQPLINAPVTQEPQKTPELQPSEETPTKPEEQPLTEKERNSLYLKKPWNKFLRDGFKFS
jgi:hypothetical protein